MDLIVAVEQGDALTAASRGIRSALRAGSIYTAIYRALCFLYPTLIDQRRRTTKGREGDEGFGSADRLRLSEERAKPWWRRAGGAKSRWAPPPLSSGGGG